MSALAPFFRQGLNGAVVSDHHDPRRCRPVCVRDIDPATSDHAYFGGHYIAASFVDDEHARLMCSAPGGLRLARAVLAIGHRAPSASEWAALRALATQTAEVASKGRPEPPELLCGDYTRTPARSASTPCGPCVDGECAVHVERSTTVRT